MSLTFKEQASKLPRTIFTTPKQRKQLKSLSHQNDIVLTDSQVEEIGQRLDKIRASVMDHVGEKERRYIEAAILFQYSCEMAGRAISVFSRRTPGNLLGCALLGISKIVDNMEIGHNVMHGQYEWLGEKKFRAKEFEWDNVCPSNQWIHSHNYIHHVNTNIVGKDKDLGYNILRVNREQEWHPYYLGNLFYNFVLFIFFEWGVMVHDADITRFILRKIPAKYILPYAKEWAEKGLKQAAKDYLFFPALKGKKFWQGFRYNFRANIIRNVWAHSIIFCGHFPHQAMTFNSSNISDETRGEWYVRQMLGSCNIYGSPLFHFFSGNLSHQIEHHLFPDMPAVNYQKIAPQVRELCREFGLPYNTGPFFRQVYSAWKTIAKGSLPNKYVRPEKQGQLRIVRDSYPLLHAS